MTSPFSVVGKLGAALLGRVTTYSITTSEWMTGGDVGYVLSK